MIKMLDLYEKVFYDWKKMKNGNEAENMRQFMLLSLWSRKLIVRLRPSILKGTSKPIAGQF